MTDYDTQLHIECLTVGDFGTNLYILSDKYSSEAIIIDPGPGSESVLSSIKRQSLKIRYIVNTHAHFDHTFNNSLFKQETGAMLCCHPMELPLLKVLPSQGISYGIEVPDSPFPDLFLEDNDILKLSENINFRVIHAPGHSPGSICLYTDGFLFSGDVIFYGSIGRTDLPGGNYQELMDSIKRKLLVLPEGTTIFPGHGQSTTIQEETKNNPFLILKN